MWNDPRSRVKEAKLWFLEQQSLESLIEAANQRLKEVGMTDYQIIIEKK